MGQLISYFIQFLSNFNYLIIKIIFNLADYSTFNIKSFLFNLFIILIYFIKYLTIHSLSSFFLYFFFKNHHIHLRFASQSNFDYYYYITHF